MLVNARAAGFERTLGLCLDPAELKLALVPWQSGCDRPEADHRLSALETRGEELYHILLGVGTVRIIYDRIV